MKTLKPNHERFLQAMLQHHSQTQAYLAVYPKSSPAAAKANASRLMRQHPEIRRRLKERHEYLLEQSKKEMLAFLKNEFEAFCAERSTYASIIKGGPVARQFPNGKIISVPSTLDDQLRAFDKMRRREDEFLEKYPMYYEVLRPGKLQTDENGDNEGYQNDRSPAA